MLFVAHLHQRGLASGTMKSYLAAVRFRHISKGLGNPGISMMPQLEYLLKGVKRLAPAGTRCRLPITPAIMTKLKDHWLKAPVDRNAKMLWAAACLCFFGFLRSGEAVAPSAKHFDPGAQLCYDDVLVDSRTAPSFVQVRLKASKTDPFRQGFTLYLGVTEAGVCPVVAVLNFMVVRGAAKGPLFVWENGQYLTRDRFVSEVRAALSALGFPAKSYAGHSFRIGAATTAAQRGVQDSLIKTLGRWESSAYMTYIRTAPETLRKVARTLVTVQS